MRESLAKMALLSQIVAIKFVLLRSSRSQRSRLFKIIIVLPHRQMIHSGLLSLHHLAESRIFSVVWLAHLSSLSGGYW